MPRATKEQKYLLLPPTNFYTAQEKISYGKFLEQSQTPVKGIREHLHVAFLANTSFGADTENTSESQPYRVP